MNKTPEQLVLELVNTVISQCSNFPHVDTLAFLPHEVQRQALQLIALMLPEEAAKLPHLECEGQHTLLAGMGVSLSGDGSP